MVIDDSGESCGRKVGIQHRQRERCPVCDTETDHGVRLGIVTESNRPTAAGPSREPYRIATCFVCGSERRQRMNSA